jgi:hypothetical protein
LNAYPSWIHRIPEMIEVLAMADAERIDRRAAERLFDLRATAAKALLGRMGADLCGHSLVISRGLLMARLREAHENPDWRWEVQRRGTVHDRIEALRTKRQRPTLVPVQAELKMPMVASLPATVLLGPGSVVIRCRDMADLLQQLVQIAKAIDNDYDTLRACVEGPIPRRPVGSATTAAAAPGRIAKDA